MQISKQVQNIDYLYDKCKKQVLSANVVRWRKRTQSTDKQQQMTTTTTNNNCNNAMSTTIATTTTSMSLKNKHHHPYSTVQYSTVQNKK